MKQLSVCVPLVLLLLTHADAATLVGTVVRVSDGDTITVLDDRTNQHKVRLLGIDAPESAQAFGNAAREHLAGILAGKVVTVSWAKRDRFGRLVGKVIVGTTDAGLEQLRDGFAWHFKKYELEQPALDRATYAAAEEDARARRRGLWAEHAIPPWEWRQLSTHTTTTR